MGDKAWSTFEKIRDITKMVDLDDSRNISC